MKIEKQLFTKLCHFFHILILDVLIGKGITITLPHDMHVYGNTDSNVNVILCQLAVPPKSVRLLGIHMHELGIGGFPAHGTENH